MHTETLSTAAPFGPGKKRNGASQPCCVWAPILGAAGYVLDAVIKAGHGLPSCGRRTNCIALRTRTPTQTQIDSRSAQTSPKSTSLHRRRKRAVQWALRAIVLFPIGPILVWWPLRASSTTFGHKGEDEKAESSLLSFALSESVGVFGGRTFDLDVGSKGGRSGVDLGSIWGRLGDRGRCGVDSGSI